MRHGLLLLLATATVIAAGSQAAPAVAAGSRDALARTVAGDLDAVVTSASGRTVGHLSASVLRSGRGAGQFRFHGAGAGASELVHFRARRSGTGARILVTRHRVVRLDLRVAADGDLRGTGRIAGRQVRIRGVAGERLRHVRRGQDMLVVGRPSGPAYDALRDVLRPVRFRRGDHGGHELLRDRKALHEFGALVIGDGVAPGDARVQAVVHRFFGTGKWVVAAPGSAALRRSLSDLHGTAFDGDARRGMAVRATGAAGGSSNVRPVVRFPAAVRGPLTLVQRRGVAASQARWFRRQLLAHGKAHDGISEERRQRARAAQAGTTDFNPPFNASVVEVRVPYLHQFTVSDSGVHWSMPVCGQETKGDLADLTVCPPARTLYPASDPCNTYLRQNQRVLSYLAVQYAAQQPNPPWGQPTDNWPWPLVDAFDAAGGLYRIRLDIGRSELQEMGLMAAFEGWHGNVCPDAGSQVGELQGNDYYYAIHQDAGNEHTVVVLTDPTVSAVVPDIPPGKLFKSGEANGNMRACHVSCGNFPLTETAWYLGSYDHALTLSGEHVEDGGRESFLYSSSKSYPNNPITWSQEGEVKGTQQSFSVGVFGDTGTGTFTSTTSTEASVSLNVPSWEVTSEPGTRDVTHSFRTNRPVAWDTITKFQVPSEPSVAMPGPAKAPWTLNGPNVGGFGPAALAVWTGDTTYGPISLTGTHTLGMVDHFTHLKLNPPYGNFLDAFAVKYLQFSDTPDGRTPSVSGKDPTTIGTGLNFCDPHIRDDKTFKDECQALYPPPKA